MIFSLVTLVTLKKCLPRKPIYFEILQLPTVLLGNCRRHNGHLITVTNSLPLAKCSPSAAVTNARATSLRKLTANGRCMKRDNWMPRGLLPLHCDGVRTVVTGVRPLDWLGQMTILTDPASSMWTAGVKMMTGKTWVPKYQTQCFFFNSKKTIEVKHNFAVKISVHRFPCSYILAMVGVTGKTWCLIENDK